MRMSKLLVKKQDFYKRYDVSAWIKGLRNFEQEWRRVNVCRSILWTADVFYGLSLS